MPEVTTFSTATCRAYMFATIVCAITINNAVFDLINVTRNKIIYDLKIIRTAFRAFLVCHFCPSFLALNPSS